MKHKTIAFIKEYLALIMAVLTFFLSPYVLRLLDPTAATYDSGVLQIIIITLVMYAVFQAVTWSIVKNLWPAIGDYMKNLFNNDFKSLLPWQKICLSLFVYFIILVLLVTLSRVIQ